MLASVSRIISCLHSGYPFNICLSGISDIASVSIDQARKRYDDLRSPKFAAYFAATDCYVHSLSSVLPDTILPPLGNPFDVVSMQFCMHYAFESEKKARTMIENVSAWLRPGGTFIGTIPNASWLL